MSNSSIPNLCDLRLRFVHRLRLVGFLSLPCLQDLRLRFDERLRLERLLDERLRFLHRLRPEGLLSFPCLHLLFDLLLDLLLLIDLDLLGPRFLAHRPDLVLPRLQVAIIFFN